MTTNEIPTPRCDAAEGCFEQDGNSRNAHIVEYVNADFARTLERDLIQANARIAEMERAIRKTALSLEIINESLYTDRDLSDSEILGTHSILIKRRAALRQSEKTIGELNSALTSDGSEVIKELDELRKDKARLDWLESQLNDTYEVLSHHKTRSSVTWEPEKFDASKPYAIGDLSKYWGENLRAAIDAMKGESK